MSEFLSLLLAVLSGASGVAVFGFGIRVLAHEVHAVAWRRSLAAFELRIPHAVDAADVARWVGLVRSLVPARHWWSLLPRAPFCLETTATNDGIRHVVIVPAGRRTAVLSALTAAIPGARLIELPEYLTGERGPGFQAATEIRLRGGAELLGTDRADDTSRHLIASMQPLQPGEIVRLQWLMSGARAPRWVARLDAESDMPGLWKTGPVLGVVARLAVGSPKGRARAKALHGRVWAALAGMNTHRTRLAARWWPRFAVAARMVLRVVPRGRWPITATADELSGLLALAVAADPLPGVPAEIARTLPPVPTMPKQGLVIGTSNYPSDAAKQLHVSTLDRLRHMWILGPTGTGKSTLLANIICQDIAHGSGLVLIDPGGDLAADVLDRIPDHRADDVIVIDPTHTDNLIGLNPLTAGPSEQASGFTFHVLQSLWAATWGPRTADIARGCLLTLTATTAPDGAEFTLVDVAEILTNPGFRRYVTAQPLPPHLMKFWHWYDRMPEPQQIGVTAPLLNKLRTFTMSSALRATLGQSVGVRFSEVIKDGRIVLVPLKKALLGDEAAALIGALVMATVWQAIQARIAIPKAERLPFWLVADEFQEVLRLPLALADMAARARSLGLGLILAHQYLDQLTDSVRAAVLGTVRSQIVFQVERDDAHTLAPRFEPLAATDLRRLGPYEIAARLCTGGATAAPVTGTTHPAPAPVRDGAALAAASRARHGQPLTAIDEQITARTTPPTGRSGAHWGRIPTGGEQP